MAADLRWQLGGEDAPLLERLLAERAVVCWLQLNYVDSILAQRLGGDGLTRGQIAMYQEWLDLAMYQEWLDRPDMKFGAAQPPLRKAGDKPLTWSGGFSYY